MCPLSPIPTLKSPTCSRVMGLFFLQLQNGFPPRENISFSSFINDPLLLPSYSLFLTKDAQAPFRHILFFSFLAAPTACGSSQGQGLNLSHSFNLCMPQLQQCWILNPLYHSGNSKQILLIKANVSSLGTEEFQKEEMLAVKPEEACHYQLYNAGCRVITIIETIMH